MTKVFYFDIININYKFYGEVVVMKKYDIIESINKEYNGKIIKMILFYLINVILILILFSNLYIKLVLIIILIIFCIKNCSKFIIKDINNILLFKIFGYPDKMNKILREIDLTKEYSDDDLIISKRFVMGKNDVLNVMYYEDIIGIYTYVISIKNYNKICLCIKDKYGRYIELRYGLSLMFKKNSNNKISKLISKLYYKCPNAVIGRKEKVLEYVNSHIVDVINDNRVDLELLNLEDFNNNDIERRRENYIYSDIIENNSNEFFIDDEDWLDANRDWDVDDEEKYVDINENLVENASDDDLNLLVRARNIAIVSDFDSWDELKNAVSDDKDIDTTDLDFEEELDCVARGLGYKDFEEFYEFLF